MAGRGQAGFMPVESFSRQQANISQNRSNNNNATASGKEIVSNRPPASAAKDIVEVSGDFIAKQVCCMSTVGYKMAE
jgi:hypothetical protein